MQQREKWLFKEHGRNIKVFTEEDEMHARQASLLYGSSVPKTGKEDYPPPMSNIPVLAGSITRRKREVAPTALKHPHLHPNLHQEQPMTQKNLASGQSQMSKGLHPVTSAITHPSFSCH